MADSTLGGGERPFNSMRELSPIYLRDAEFWRLHGIWQERIDAYEIYPWGEDECPIAEKMAEDCTAAMDDMFRQRVCTSAAMLAKYQAWITEGERDRLGDGSSVLEQLELDLQALARIEAGNAA